MKRNASDVTPDVLQEIIDKWDQFYADPEQHDPAVERRILDRLLSRQQTDSVEPEDAVHIAAIMKYLREQGEEVQLPAPLHSRLELSTPRLGASRTEEDEELSEDGAVKRLVKTANALDELGFSLGADGIDSRLPTMMMQNLLQDKLRELDAAVRGHDKYTREAEELAGLAQSNPSMDLIKQVQGLTERAMTSKLRHALRVKRGPRGGVQRDDDILLNY